MIALFQESARENDILLHTILNHIAYVNRASGSSESGFAHCSHDATPTSRKKQVRFVLKITYATAVLGFALTLAEFFQKFGPYGKTLVSFSLFPSVGNVCTMLAQVRLKLDSRPKK